MVGIKLNSKFPGLGSLQMQITNAATLRTQGWKFYRKSIRQSPEMHKEIFHFGGEGVDEQMNHSFHSGHKVYP